MTITSLLATFTRVPLFSGLRDDQISNIARVAERVVYQTGDIIQEQGEIGDAAILIVSGKAVVVDEAASPAEGVAPGSLVSELAMLVDARNASTIVARSPVRAFRIPRRDLRAVLEADPRMAEHFAHQISQRLTRMAAEMRRIDAMVAASVATPAPGIDFGLRAAQAPILH
jgi:CRP-like cAMP-binding protein